MTRAIVVREHGGPEVLIFEEVVVGKPGHGEVRVKVDAAGLNFIDVYHRTGLYPVDLPVILGQEGAGRVTETGPGVTGLAVGDLVAYSSTFGSYAEERVIAADAVFKAPDGLEADVAAAIMLKGMTALYLLTMTWKLQKGETILLHAAAGGVGLIASQWARDIGARVIGTVGTGAKAQLARDNGCDEVVILDEEDFPSHVRDLTGGRGVDVVYDSIGKDSFEGSLKCLRPRGLMVSYGNSSGPVSVPSLGILASGGSLYVTRPTSGHYFPDRAAREAGANAVFEMVLGGRIAPIIGQTFPLAEAAAAHRALEGRKTIGSTLLKP